MAVPRGTSPAAVDECGAAGVVPLVKVAYGAAGNSTLVPADAVGLGVNPAQLDAANDEVATGASAGQTGGITKYRFLSAATINDDVIKASAGRFYGIVGIGNANAAIRYIKIYDKATAPDPSGGDLPAFTLSLPAIGSLGLIPNLIIPGGVAMANGVGMVCVTGAGDTNETAVAAGEIFATILYK